MDYRASKDEEAIGIEAKGASLVDTPQIEEEEYSNILESKNMSKREFYWLWAGVLIQALCSSFESCLNQGIIGAVAEYFGATSLTAVLPTILAVLGTALVPFYTKVADVFGRAGSLTYAFTSYLVGLTIEASAQSFLHLAIGQIFYGMGVTGIQALSQVVIADTTSLLHRGIMFAMYDMGNVANIWVAQALIDPVTLGGARDKWRIGYISMVCVAAFGALALLVPLWYVQQSLKRRKVAQPPRRTLGWLVTEFDFPGAILIILALSLTLMPLVLARRVAKNWQDPSIIAMFSSGLILFVLLFVWEAKFAKRPIMSIKIWTNRTAFGGLMIMFLLKVLGNVVWQYLTQYFVVSRDLTFGQSYLLVRGFQMAWLIFQLIAALIMKRYKKARLMVWIGIIVYVIGVGLMIPARSQDASTFLVVISQTIAGAGGGMAHLACSVLVTGVVHKKDLATVVGATQILVSFGSAVGNALAGGIWTQYLPSRLDIHVTGPYDRTRAMNEPTKYVKLLDPVTKQQVIDAYSDSQWFMSVIGLAVAVLTIGCAAMLQHVNLEQDQDTQDLIALGKEVPETEDEKVAVKI
ncbi:MAG: major facilitator superfamily domain-containing protein [Linnemannia gamsii]|nr:MAG: major facilitator superfamily domain-containing protein [Linnemannia gamsii]